MSLTNLRFFKSGLYDTSIFICGSEEPVYQQLIGYHNKVLNMDLGTRSPLFFNEEKQYITISFKGVKQQLEQKKYDIQVIFKEVKKNEKVYINAYVGKIELSTEQNEIQSKIISLD